MADEKSDGKAALTRVLIACFGALVLVTFALGALVVIQFQHESGQQNLVEVESTVYLIEPSRNFRVHEFRLTDGTRCVVAFRGGLDCEWRGE